MEIQSFTNQTVIITGASKGIGRGIAKAYAKEGASVLLVARNQEKLSELEEEIKSLGGKVLTCSADVSNENDVQKVVDVALDAFGHIDILCHNAGIYPEKRLDEMQLIDWTHVIDVNLTGTFLMVSKCLPHMKAQNKGKIAVISSISGPVTGLPKLAHYTASKGGVEGFIKTAAIELAKFNIQINSVQPGNILTEGLLEVGEEYLQNQIKAIPAKRLGTPEDIANAALFLTSKASSFITGQSLIVDGGQTLPESHFSDY